MSIDAAKNSLKTDRFKWAVAFESVQKLRNAMRQFNENLDSIFVDIDRMGNDGNACSIDMQQRLGGGKCQITRVLDSKECICYAMDLDG